MSGPGDSASMWEALTRKNAQTDPELEKDWTALCAAWTQFHATMERHIAATHSAPAPSVPAPAKEPAAANTWPMMPPLPTAAANPAPAAPSIFEAMARMTPPQPVSPPPAAPAEPVPNAVNGKPTETQLAAREQYVLNSIQSISATMTAEVTRISTIYMSGGMAANQVNGHLSTQYNFALGAFQLLRVEASALKDLGKGESLRVLDLFVDDTKKALGIVGNMVSQQHAFEIGISKIWQDTMISITSTQLDINKNARIAYEKANAAYFSKY